ncbi:unnamed protein product [Ilex paraguariensis]|uniref:Uncharacterized protein n=1 Tax=Ilex paraguariensis TaxID=185542 RepID=A0ABC8U3N6_9AQUA
MTVVNCDRGFTFYEILKLGEVSEISPLGVLKKANQTSWGVVSVLYSVPLSFKNSSKEVACGRRPVDSKAPSKEVILVDWVLDCLIGGKLLKMADPKLKNEFEVEEMLLVLKVGLLCSHPVAAVRPSISQVLLYLKGYAPVPENLDALLSTHELDAIMLNHSVYETKHSTPLVTVTEELTGR